MERAKAIIYIILTISIIAGCYYLHRLSTQLETMVYHNEMIINDIIRDDTLNTDTAKIKYINTDNNEENESTEKRKRN